MPRALLEAAMAQQHVKPRVELLLQIKPIQTPERIKKCVLRGISSVGIVTRERSRMPQGTALVAMNQMLKCPWMPRSAQPDCVNVFHRLIQVSGNRRKSSGRPGERQVRGQNGPNSLLKFESGQGEARGDAPLAAKKLAKNCPNRRRPEQVELMCGVFEDDHMRVR